MFEGENFYRRMKKDEMVFYRIIILTLADKRYMNDIKYQHLKAITIWSFMNINNTEFIFVQRIIVDLLKIFIKENCVGGRYLILTTSHNIFLRYVCL